MGLNKYSKYDGARKIEERPWQIHPIWRGLGCIMLIIVPMISFLGAYILVEQGIIATLLANLKFTYPPEFTSLLFSFDFMGTTYNVDIMTLIITGLLILIGFAALMILYSILYGALGPPRYGPLDAKPERYKSKQRIKSKR